MKKLISVAILLLINFPSLQMEEKEIKVAIYFSSVKRFAEEVEEAINYTWIKGNIKYIIKPEVINKRDVIEGKLSNYDVFVIPGSARPYFDAYNLKWREEVIKFIENGGGYVGICGGANLVSMGFNEGISLNTPLDVSVLKLVDVYVNDQQEEEWQYLWKSNWRHGGPPIKIHILKSEIPIFDGFYGKNRSIRYWGGPGMYEAGLKNEKMGDVIPLAIYAEEPMEIAPLHYWKWENDRWIPYKNVTTDIKGQYAVVASTYGNGRLVLFGPHPERNTFFDGHVEEFPVRNSRFTWFIYNWVSNNSSTMSYNWWILRRSIAWVAGLEKDEMPYASQIAGYIEEPKYGLYLNGRKIIYLQNTIIIGSFTLHAQIIDANAGIIKVDGKEIYQGKGDIFLTLNLPAGIHKISAIAKNEKEEAGNKISIIVLA